MSFFPRSLSSSSRRCASSSFVIVPVFTLADFAFAVASNWNKPLNVSTTSQITFLGTAKGARLVAEARKVKEGRSTCYYLVDVSDDLGNPVAHVTASGFVKSGTRLVQDMPTAEKG